MIALAVMHDQRREVMLGSLMRSIRVELDSLDDADRRQWYGSIVVGEGTNDGPWSAMRSALTIALEMHAGITHVLLLEDDAVPCHGFLRAVSRAIESKPNEVLYLFATPVQAGMEMNRAKAEGKAWAKVDRRALPSLACVMPVSDVRAFLDWFGNPEVEAIFRAVVGNPADPSDGVSRAGDARLWMYLKTRHRSGWLSAWSLVEHGCPAPSESLTGMAHQYHRIAHNPVWGLRPGAHEGTIAASEIDWSK